MDTTVLDQRLNRFGSMRKGTIPNQDHRLLQLSSKDYEEISDSDGIDIGVGMKTKIKMDSVSFRSDAKGSNHRNLLVRTGALIQDGRLSTWCPTSANKRRHQHSTFIYEDYEGFQVCGFFLIRGHSCLTQRCISFSSLSIARLCGFWGLQPRERSKRPI